MPWWGNEVMKYLYCYNASKEIDDANCVSEISCSTFTPRLRGLLLPGESRSIKRLGTRLLFQIITLGKAQIFYVAHDQDLMHTSYVVPTCYKFSFMDKHDYEIGPCFTYPKYRGRGIYPSVLRSICHNIGNEDTKFYMIVDEANIASIKGIEKAGFTKCGIIKVTKFTKRYLLERTS